VFNTRLPLQFAQQMAKPKIVFPSCYEDMYNPVTTAFISFTPQGVFSHKP